MLEGSEEFARTLEEYVHLVMRRRWWLLLPAASLALLTVGAALLLPNVYRSETVILVEHQQVPEHYVVSNLSADLRSRLQTMTQQILSRTRLLRIIDESGLYAHRRQRAPEELVELMRQNIGIEMLEGDPRRLDLNAFKIAFSASDPRLAQQITAQLSSLFIEENLKAREQQSLGTTNFLRDQLEAARLELQEQEKRLGEFKTRHLGELPEQQTSNLTVLAGLQMQLQTTAAALDHARQQRVYLKSLLPHYQSMAEAGGSLPGTPGDPGLTAVENELARLRNERASLLARYTSQHPDIRKVDEQIAQAEVLKAQLARSRKGAEGGNPQEATALGATPTATAIAQTQSQLQANETEIESLAQAVARLEQQINQYQHRLNLTPLREQQFADVFRDYSLSKQNYEELLKKKMESELATNMEKRQQGEQFRILDPPSLPAKPYRPNRRRISVMGVMLGLGLGVSLAFLAEVRDRSVYTERDLRRLVPLPLVLGVPELLTSAEQQQRWRRQCGEWIAGLTLILAVAASQLLIFWRG